MRVQATALSNAGISNSGMRCVPDAAADADPASGYVVIMCGLFQPLVKRASNLYWQTPCLTFSAHHSDTHTVMLTAKLVCLRVAACLTAQWSTQYCYHYLNSRLA